MKLRFLSWIILFALQMPLVNQWGAVAYYRVNQDYIAKNLCVNRDKPKMNCNGQCYLAKQLKAQEEKESKTANERLEKLPEIILTFQEINQSPALPNLILFQNQVPFHYISLHGIDLQFGLIKPPATV
jgi:hypothetical protein